MLKIGKTYKLPETNADVEIVGSGVGKNLSAYPSLYSGQFFVGITRNTETGDWSANYRPDGTRIWDSPPAHPSSSAKYDLDVPPVMLNLTQVEKLIRNLAQSLDISEDAAETVIDALEKLDVA